MSVKILKGKVPVMVTVIEENPLVKNLKGINVWDITYIPGGRKEVLVIDEEDLIEIDAFDKLKIAILVSENLRFILEEDKETIILRIQDARIKDYMIYKSLEGLTK